jgi:hypothetical protein
MRIVAYSLCLCSVFFLTANLANAQRPDEAPNKYGLDGTWEGYTWVVKSDGVPNESEFRGRARLVLTERHGEVTGVVYSCYPSFIASPPCTPTTRDGVLEAAIYDRKVVLDRNESKTVGFFVAGRVIGDRVINCPGVFLAAKPVLTFYGQVDEVNGAKYLTIQFVTGVGEDCHMNMGLAYLQKK